MVQERPYGKNPAYFHCATEHRWNCRETMVTGKMHGLHTRNHIKTYCDDFFLTEIPAGTLFVPFYAATVVKIKLPV
jgi:hypothetical protein